MAIRINEGLNTVTAGAFVQIGGKSVDLREKISRVGQVVSNAKTDESLNNLQTITSDGVITPSEKAQIKKEWEHIQAAYNSTVSMVEDLGVNPDEYLSFQSAYNSLKAMMDSILSDMSSSSNTDGSLDSLLQAYQSSATILQNWINSYSNDLTANLSDYSLRVSHTPQYPTLDSTITFTAYIYIKGIDKTEELMSSHEDESGLYPDLFIWDVSGTSDDESIIESIKGKRTWQISASQLAYDVIRARFSSSLYVS